MTIDELIDNATTELSEWLNADSDIPEVRELLRTHFAQSWIAPHGCSGLYWVAGNSDPVRLRSYEGNAHCDELGYLKETDRVQRVIGPSEVPA